MKINNILAASLIAALGFTACAKDSGEKIEKKGNPAEVTVNLKAPKATRADGGTEPGEGNEIAVTSLEFFVFDSSGTPDSETPYLRKTAGLNSATTLPITAGDGKQFLVGVNTNIFADLAAYEAAAATPANVVHAEILKKITALELINTNSKTNPGSGGFVMSAEATKNVLEAPAVNTLTMTIERTLSKVESPVAAANLTTTAVAEDLDMLKELWPAVAATADIENLTWDFDGYVVINGIKNSYVFERDLESWTAPYLSPATGASWFKTTYADASGVAINTVYGGSGTDDNFIAAGSTDVVYVYENSPEKIAGQPGEATTFVKDQVTAFLIKGTFSCDDSATYPDVTRYWRVNLIKDDVWKVYRNSIYRITLNNVLTPGYATPKDAENTDPIVDPNETSITIDLNIAPWYIKIQGVDF